jgi:threonine/homoserine/homoserine lactone efflux protein
MLNVIVTILSSMLGLSTLGVFVAAAVALLLFPGPAVIYIVTRSLGQGRVAGLVSVLGVCTGTLVHVVAAALGLSALMMSSALAFTVVKYLGAAYLIVLGSRTLVSPYELPTPLTVSRDDLRRVYTQGVIVNVLNPHTALFFLAFLPQFVNPSRGHASAQIIVLGLLFVLLSIFFDSVWALAAGTTGDWIKRNPQFARRQRYLTGGALIGLGAATAFTGRTGK